MLVGDVADDLLDHVLEGDDAGVPAVLVEDDGHLEPVTTEDGEQWVETERVRHHDRFRHDVLDLGGRPLRYGQGDGVLDVDRPDHVVLVVQHREARVPRLPGQLDHGDRPVVLLQARGADPRGHDLAGGAGAELHRALHQLRGLDVQGAEVGRPLDQGRQLGRAPADRSSSCGSMPSRRTTAFAELLSSRIGRALTRVNVRWNELGRARGLHRPGDGEVLGHELAEDHGQRRADGEGDRHRHGMDQLVGQAGGRQGSVDQLGDGRLRQEADGEVGDGDPDLRSGELGGQGAQRQLDADRARVTGGRGRSTLLRSTVTNANSAATNTPQAAISRSATPSRIHSVMRAPRSG